MPLIHGNLPHTRGTQQSIFTLVISLCTKTHWMKRTYPLQMESIQMEHCPHSENTTWFMDRITESPTWRWTQTDKVRYHHKKWRRDSNPSIPSYSQVEPSIFQTGDVVEASIAFVVLPVREDRYVMIPQLRSLMLLDNSIRQVRHITTNGWRTRLTKMFRTTEGMNQRSRLLQGANNLPSSKEKPFMLLKKMFKRRRKRWQRCKSTSRIHARRVGHTGVDYIRIRIQKYIIVLIDLFGKNK